MADNVINLNKARKAREKSNKKLNADENAVRFGRSKQERQLNDIQNKKSSKSLDDHRLDE